MGKRSRRRRIVIWSLIGLGVIVVLFGVAALVTNLIVTRSAADSIVQNLEDAPRAQAAIVLGARVYADGTPSPMLVDRLETGIKLYKMGKVKKLLLSGDHGQVEYDEVNVMLDYVLARGVPTEDVFTDHAGFDTYDTMYRAIDVFQVQSALIVTQEFHLARSVYTAQQLGLDAVGVVGRHPAVHRRVPQPHARVAGSGQGHPPAAHHPPGAHLPGTAATDRRRRPHDQGLGALASGAAACGLRQSHSPCEASQSMPTKLTSSSSAVSSDSGQHLLGLDPPGDDRSLPIARVVVAEVVARPADRSRHTLRVNAPCLDSGDHRSRVGKHIDDFFRQFQGPTEVATGDHGRFTESFGKNRQILHVATMVLSGEGVGAPHATRGRTSLGSCSRPSARPSRRSLPGPTCRSGRTRCARCLCAPPPWIARSGADRPAW